MNLLRKAAISHYSAKRDEALATLEVYFQRAAGIGEHSKLLAEVTQWTEVLANADDCLQALDNHFDADGRVVG
ncbi:MAG: hypothetical protein FJ295_00525 [Planctomycetes bacterium]|nr:hypothetical protein [Planctomycetota bacterium]